MTDVKYLGPSGSVNVGEFGAHAKDQVKPYPADIAAELIRSSKKQRFELVDQEDSSGANGGDQGDQGDQGAAGAEKKKYGGGRGDKAKTGGGGK